jgi:hypothetical protein
MTALVRRKQHDRASRRLFSCSLFIILLLCGCGSTPRPTITSRLAENAQVVAQPAPVESPGQFVSILEFVKGLNVLAMGANLFTEDEKAGMLKAWRRVDGYANYRMARAEDFKLPEQFKEADDWDYVKRAFERPFMTGELNGNQHNNLVLLAVDQTKTGPQRFSIILFIGRAANSYEVHWMRRDEDLSRLTINRHSGDIALQEFKEDGTRSFCDIEWESKLKSYTCK